MASLTLEILIKYDVEFKTWQKEEWHELTIRDVIAMADRGAKDGCPVCDDKLEDAIRELLKLREAKR